MAKTVFDLAIQTEVEKQIRTGEKISAFVQAGIVLFFVSLWAIAPRALDFNQTFEVIPLVMSVYGPIILIRLYLALKEKISYTISFIYTFVDIIAILACIFLYHIQYNAAPAMSLKSPTYAFLILMIALRVLSFRPSLVLLATALTTLGWSALTLYTYLNTKTTLTSSFVDYTSTDYLLIGAEVEKILALIAIGSVLATAVYYSSKLLTDSVLSIEKTKKFSLFFSPEVSNMIQSGQIEIKAGKGEKREAAVLFIDLRGFTQMSLDLDPNEVMQTLSSYHKIIVPIIQNNKGSIDKFMGDGVLAHFGASHKTDTYAANALQAIEQIKIAIDEWNQKRIKQKLQPIKVNMACAVGPLIFGATGDDNRLEITTIGSVVNFTAKLEKNNKQLDACVSVTVKLLDQAEKQGYAVKNEFKVAKKQQIDGMSEDMDVYYLSNTSNNLTIL